MARSVTIQLTLTISIITGILMLFCLEIANLGKFSGSAINKQ